MRHFTVNVFASATVSAENEESAREVLETLARSNQVFLSEMKKTDKGYVSAYCTIDVSPDLKLEYLGED